MGQLQREVARLFAVQSQKAAAAAAAQGGMPGKQLLHYVPSPPTKSRARRALANLLLPVWFKYFRGPLDRWNLAVMAKYLRDHGLMYDDLYSDKEPVIARALEMLPPDIAAARYRRLMRGANLNHLRLYLPLHGRKKNSSSSRADTAGCGTFGSDQSGSSSCSSNSECRSDSGLDSGSGSTSTAAATAGGGEEEEQQQHEENRSSWRVAAAHAVAGSAEIDTSRGV